jgi:polyhydroxybutyrate depolymerase
MCRCPVRAIRRLGRAAQIAAVATLTTAGATAACGQDTDCVVGDRTYRIALPDPAPETAPAATRPGAIIFVHGYRGRAEKVMRFKALTALASKLGVALIVPQAAGPEWYAPGAPSEDTSNDVDDLAYFDALTADAVKRFDLDRARIVVAGFSSGAMMVWNLACQRGDAYAGFIPMSGTFWAPLPEDCPTGAVNLIHYHGREDPVVPMSGREIKDAYQGDVREAFAMMTRVGGYGPATETTEDDLACERQSNPAGKLLELCLFTGEHGMKVRNIARAWREIGAANGW